MQPDNMLDEEYIRQQQELLKIHRRNLQNLLIRAAKYGGEPSSPLEVVNSLHETRTQILQIKEILRSNDIPVQDYRGEILAPVVPHIRKTPPPIAHNNTRSNLSQPMFKPIVSNAAPIVGGLVVVLLIAVLFLSRQRDPSGTTVFAPTTAPIPTAPLNLVSVTSAPPIKPTIKTSATAATGASPFLLSDTFDDASSSKFREHEDSHFSSKFSNGTYVITLNEPNFHIDPAIGTADYSDAAIEVDVTIQGPPTGVAGIVFRYQDFKNYYMFVVDSAGRYSLLRLKDQFMTRLIDQKVSSDIKVGEMNKLRVVANGNTILLYANGTKIDEVTDDALTSGKARLVVDSSDDANVIATFDNLTVEAIQ